MHPQVRPPPCPPLQLTLQLINALPSPPTYNKIIHYAHLTPFIAITCHPPFCPPASIQKSPSSHGSANTPPLSPPHPPLRLLPSPPLHAHFDHQPPSIPCSLYYIFRGPNGERASTRSKARAGGSKPRNKERAAKKPPEMMTVTELINSRVHGAPSPSSLCLGANSCQILAVLGQASPSPTPEI